MAVQTLRKALGMAILVLVFSAGANADCDKAETPELPDAKTASRDEMVAAQLNIQAFLKHTEDYLVCVKGGRRFDKAIAVMNDVAEGYNKQLRQYRKRVVKEDPENSATDLALTEL